MEAPSLRDRCLTQAERDYCDLGMTFMEQARALELGARSKGNGLFWYLPPVDPAHPWDCIAPIVIELD